ncbi:MAG: site-specific DNA-methyltransferase, partial [Oscillospiraceae bacterium]
KERYNFTWNGKGRALRLAQTPSMGTLRPCPEESKNWDDTENLYLEGDNLEVLKLLQKSYHGKIKMIYIDPPYNTGGDFVYPDDFSDNIENYKKITGQVDSEGKRLGTNAETSGRYHTDWLNMMYPRLRLARNLLTDDGVIFISIDDNEQSNLRKICDIVFGEENFVGLFPWRKRTAKSDVPFGVSQDYEWILCCSKSNMFSAATESCTRKYYESDDFPNRPWRVHDMTTQRTALERPNSDFTIINPKTGDKYPVNPQAVWRITKDTIADFAKEN